MLSLLFCREEPALINETTYCTWSISCAAAIGVDVDRAWTPFRESGFKSSSCLYRDGVCAKSSAFLLVLVSPTRYLSLSANVALASKKIHIQIVSSTNCASNTKAVTSLLLYSLRCQVFSSLVRSLPSLIGTTCFLLFMLCACGWRCVGEKLIALR